MDRRFDVVVVGAGPAGSLAALQAAKAGASVLVLEKKRRVGSLPHCAEYVPRLLAMELDFPPRAKVQPVEGMVSHLGANEHFSKVPGWILDRQVFDAGLSEQAARAGARIWANAALLGQRQDAWVIKRGADEHEISCGALVAADGAASFVARALGLARQPLLAGPQMVVPLAKGMTRNHVYLRPEFLHGYAWLFPRGLVANLGLGCRTQARPMQRLRELRMELLDQGVIGPGVLAISGGAIPIGGPRERLFHGQVLLAGDAAGLTHPMTGAGIPQAIFSGKEAGEAAARLAGGQREAAQEYEHAVLGRFGGYLQRGLQARQEQEAAWEQGDFAALMQNTWPGLAGGRNG